MGPESARRRRLPAPNLRPTISWDCGKVSITSIRGDQVGPGSAQECAGIIQNLIVAFPLHAIDPYDYLVNVLQRVGQHHTHRVYEPAPRLWAPRFAADLQRSTLHTLRESPSRPRAY